MPGREGTQAKQERRQADRQASRAGRQASRAGRQAERLAQQADRLAQQAEQASVSEKTLGGDCSGPASGWPQSWGQGGHEKRSGPALIALRIFYQLDVPWSRRRLD